MKESKAEEYKSKSQIARVLTEDWLEREMYCPACDSESLEKLPDNTEIKDFICPDCKETFQLKAKSRSFENKVANSEYNTKVKKIKKGLSPNSAFLRYDIDKYVVEELMVLQRHFMTLDAVEARKPLSDEARRSGWTGSNILLNEFPEDAFLYIIEDGKIRKKSRVRRQWQKFEFMENKDLDSKGWFNDVLNCIRKLDKEEFTLQEMYKFKNKLKKTSGK